ncbi:MAG: bifunctional fucokinase/L-fucose-1-P-guanylyltransferase, partial [Lentisphaerae bacterium]|nr:bifunctional fucokinase/L-fucose-1-P-guanylyltransferase [Lentisphaerota bacterium]
GQFYHFGTSRELVDTTLRLQNAHLDQRRFGRGGHEHPAAFLQNADVGVGLHAGNHTVWIENAVLPPTWSVRHSHVLTGIPANDWSLRLPAGVCLDAVPLTGGRWALRFYGIDDAFRGPLGDPGTRWLGQAASAWFRGRGLDPDGCGLDTAVDLQQSALFPVLSDDEMASAGAYVQWLIGEPEAPGASGDAALINRPVSGGRASGAAATAATAGQGDGHAWARRYREGARLSASALAQEADLVRRGRQRAALRSRALERLAGSAGVSVFLRTDLAVAAAEFARKGLSLPAPESVAAPLDQLHLRMFRAMVRRHRGEADWAADERAAFETLRQLFVAPGAMTRSAPRRQLLADQIIWGRSPVRLDLAGGWTDTPPYCLVHGGRVVNLAVELNGQPPIQVFARCCDEPHVVVRSIDLGQEERLETYEDLRRYAEVGAAFSIPRAALALAGFLPEFAAQPDDSLRRALERFGGGIELSLLAAVPKGSGLGTSSILAATVLGTLNDLCCLGWSRDEVIRRTLCLEQMLTTGGGWQDQAGGILASAKLLESAPGSPQVIQSRWLPDAMLRQQSNHGLLLYYTGITRLAKDILQDVVRGMFLNAAGTLQRVGRIGENALRAADVLQRQDYAGLGAVVRRSWELNCALDAGTNPPAIAALLARVEPWLLGAKLLGAGGGGFLLMVAADDEAAWRIRQELTAHPPNAVARFVDMGISEHGLQVTRS